MAESRYISEKPWNYFGFLMPFFGLRRTRTPDLKHTRTAHLLFKENLSQKLIRGGFKLMTSF